MEETRGVPRATPLAAPEPSGFWCKRRPRRRPPPRRRLPRVLKGRPRRGPHRRAALPLNLLLRPPWNRRPPRCSSPLAAGLGIPLLARVVLRAGPPRRRLRLPDAAGPLALHRGQGRRHAAYAKRRAELRADAEGARRDDRPCSTRGPAHSLGFRASSQGDAERRQRRQLPRAARRRRREAPRGTVLRPDTEAALSPDGVGSGLIVKPATCSPPALVRAPTACASRFASGQSLGIDAGRRTAVRQRHRLAVIRLPADLPCALCEDTNVTSAFADSDREVDRGDLVGAGSPLGLKQTVTHGIISAKGRLLDRITLVELCKPTPPSTRQTPAVPVRPDGRVVGVNVAIASDNGGTRASALRSPATPSRRCSTSWRRRARWRAATSGVPRRPDAGAGQGTRTDEDGRLSWPRCCGTSGGKAGLKPAT